MYKQIYQSTSILRLADGAIIPADSGNRDYQEYLAWSALGNTALPADQPTPEQLAKQAEITQAPITARQYFLGHQAAIDFVRLDPTTQETQIDAMSLAQLKTVVKYLTIATSAIIKEKFL